MKKIYFYVMLLVIFIMPIKVWAEDDCVFDNSWQASQHNVPVTTFVTTLDDNFEYADIELCTMKFRNYVDKNTFFTFDSYSGFSNNISFNGYNFCGVTSSNANERCDFQLASSNSCPEGYGAFRINFNNGSDNYVGFGCRKDKEEVVENAIEISISVNNSDQVDLFQELAKRNYSYNDSYKCELVNIDEWGNIATWNNQTKCQLQMDLGKVGETIVNIRDGSTLKYKITIKSTFDATITSGESLDKNKYDYRSPSGCTGVDLETWDGVNFCYNRNNNVLTCPSGFDLFDMQAHLSNNIDVTVKGCRQLKPTSNQGGSGGSTEGYTGNSRLNYSSICSNTTDGNNGIRKAAKIVGYIIAIIKWIVAMLLIVFGIIDYAKATVSGDENALKKATVSFIRRIIAGIAVILVPILIRGVVNVLEETRDSLSTEEAKSNFAACTKCLFDPFNNCDTTPVVGNNHFSNGSSSGGGSSSGSGSGGTSSGGGAVNTTPSGNFTSNWTSGSITLSSKNMIGIAHEPLKNFMDVKGFNQQLMESVISSGVGSRDAVVKVATGIIKYLADNYHYVLPYTYGGGHYGTINDESGNNVQSTSGTYYGINPNWGAKINYQTANNYGPDCSAWVVWVYHTAGVSNMNFSNYRKLGTSHPMNKNFIGSPGDLINSPHHIMIIVGVDTNKGIYYISHASGTSIGVIISTQKIDGSACADCEIIDMSNKLDNPSTVSDATYRNNFNKGMINY